VLVVASREVFLTDHAQKATHNCGKNHEVHHIGMGLGGVGIDEDRGSRILMGGQYLRKD
jgi:hypothetical protein